MYRKHYLVSWALLRVEEDVIIIALLYRVVPDISHSTVNDGLYEAITDAADEKEQHGADQDESAGFRVFQHDLAIVCVTDVPPILLHVLHAFPDTIFIQHERTV